MRIFYARLANAPEHHKVSTNNKLNWNFTPRRIHNLKNLKQTKADRNKKKKLDKREDISPGAHDPRL